MYFRLWPYGVTPEKHPTIWADRRDLFDTLSITFENFADRKRSFIQPFWGYLGAGKTHTLWHFGFLYGDARKLTFVYSKFPTQARNFFELYRDGFVPSFDFEAFVRKCTCLWKKLLTDKTEEEAFFWILNQIAHGSYDFAQIVYNLAKIWDISPMKALRDPLFGLSRMWLQGAKLSKREMSAIGVTKDLTKDPNAILTIGGIVRLLTCKEAINEGLEALPVVWVMDDCHVLFARSSKEQELIQRGIRRVIDECPSNLLVIMSFATSDPEKIQTGLIEELKTVTARSLVEVPPLTKEDALLFITDLISHDDFRKLDTTNKFYPYEEESILGVINAITNKGIDLLPRNVIKCFEHLTDEAQKEQLEIIDPKFVDKFFEKNCSPKQCPLFSFP